MRKRRDSSGMVRNVRVVARPYNWVLDELRDVFEDHDQWMRVTWAARGLADDATGAYPCFTFEGLPERWLSNGEVQFIVDEYESETVNVADIVTFTPIVTPEHWAAWLRRQEALP